MPEEQSSKIKAHSLSNSILDLVLIEAFLMSSEIRPS